MEFIIKYREKEIKAHRHGIPRTGDKKRGSPPKRIVHKSGKHKVRWGDLKGEKFYKMFDETFGIEKINIQQYIKNQMHRDRNEKQQFQR